ncbi:MULTISPECIES: DUF924 family protein [Cyanophyceae]|jgi:uncharacterized protein (DUF924 family)|uniref:DUF924 domain-containing protein n=1 Tax=Aphanothece cf. minutissima CCALA 015 TaxID=2107695 RepID=A0ABX5FC43_9CHRO|nr:MULTISPECIES: DUF924 family protein [Cyanophyceae]MCP9933459.1 DUF924 domain-containing protein [Cyanobium sp. Candia 9D4]PSB39504.1 DUF924 domain-containing protein [Aphanothece cf. minutissima CCALA 015]
MPTPQEVLRFWFEETPPSAWFRPGPDRDRTVRERFGALTDQALDGGLAPWGERPAEALALLLVLDQFPRQIWRDQARAFAGDGQALALTLRAVEAGWVAAEPAPERRPFWLMPLMHSEDPAVQELGLPLFERHTDARTAEFARRHQAVIARFGRFPHRNRILGRPSLPEEEAFLQQPGSRF